MANKPGRPKTKDWTEFPSSYPLLVQHFVNSDKPVEIPFSEMRDAQTIRQDLYKFFRALNTQKVPIAADANRLRLSIRREINSFILTIEPRPTPKHVLLGEAIKEAEKS